MAEPKRRMRDRSPVMIDVARSAICRASARVAPASSKPRPRGSGHCKNRGGGAGRAALAGLCTARYPQAAISPPTPRRGVRLSVQRSPPMPDLVLLDVRDGVATITLNNPEKLNAFTGDMREHMGAALDQVAADPSVRVLMITGAGRAFCAGGDVKHMVGLKQRGTGFEAMLPLLEAGRATVLRIDALPFPTIAAVNGPAAGGGMSLALACDLRIASDQATFCEAFTRIGLHVDWGGSYFLPRMVGLAKSLELCWLADVVDAGEALRVGLVNRVVPHAAFRDEVQALAARLAAAPQTSVRWT